MMITSKLSSSKLSIIIIVLLFQILWVIIIVTYSYFIKNLILANMVSITDFSNFLDLLILS